MKYNKETLQEVDRLMRAVTRRRRVVMATAFAEDYAKHYHEQGFVAWLRAKPPWWYVGQGMEAYGCPLSNYLMHAMRTETVQVTYATSWFSNWRGTATKHTRATPQWAMEVLYDFDAQGKAPITATQALIVMGRFDGGDV